MKFNHNSCLNRCRILFLNDIFDNRADMMFALGFVMVFLVTPVWATYSRSSGLPHEYAFGAMAATFIILYILLASISPRWVKFDCSKCGSSCCYADEDKMYDLDYIRPLYRCSGCQAKGELYEI